MPHWNRLSLGSTAKLENALDCASRCVRSYVRAIERHPLCTYVDVTTLSVLGDWVTLPYFVAALRVSPKPMPVSICLPLPRM